MPPVTETEASYLTQNNLLNPALSSTMNIPCYKGVDPADTKTYQIDPTTLLSDVRTLLTTDGFMPADDSNNNVGYRFVSLKTKNTQNLNDCIINESVESLVQLSGVLGNANQLIITNEFATTKPDLMGIATAWWFNRYVSAQCTLNMSDPDAITQNQSIQAFPPLMLTNVIPTSQNVVGIYDNVCVCCDGAVVQFTINSWGSAGFQFYIGSDAGEPIVQDLNMLFGWGGGALDTYGSSGPIRRWESEQKTIQINATSELTIPSGQTISYQKVTFKTKRVTAWSNGNESHSSNTNPPPLMPPPSIKAQFHPMLHAMAQSNIQTNSMAALADAVVLPGQGITPGAPTQGGGSGQQWGPPASITTDDWTQALGEVVVFFFVFKTHDDAVKIINGYNAPNPNIWQ